MTQANESRKNRGRLHRTSGAKTRVGRRSRGKLRPSPSIDEHMIPHSPGYGRREDWVRAICRGRDAGHPAPPAQVGLRLARCFVRTPLAVSAVFSFVSRASVFMCSAPFGCGRGLAGPASPPARLQLVRGHCLLLQQLSPLHLHRLGAPLQALQRRGLEGARALRQRDAVDRPLVGEGLLA